MQQPNSQQPSALWPGVPGKQPPLPGQASQFPAVPQAPFAFPPQPQPQATQMPIQGYPAQQPYAAQPYQKPLQPSPQFQVQQQALPGTQGQAAPVPPVAFPASPYGAQKQPSPQAAPQSQAQMMARQLVELARTLEQIFPGFQLLQSVLTELASTPAGQTVAGLDEAIRFIKEIVYCHGSALGSIRRLLMGDTSPGVLTALASSFQKLSGLHAEARPVLERLNMAAPVALRNILSQAGQSVGAAGGLLGQAGPTIQALVGPQVWEAARVQQSQEPI